MAIAGIALAVLGGLASLVGAIMLLIAAFRRSVPWGLAVIFIPFAALVFIVKCWAEARRAFIVQAAGLAASLAAMALVMAGGAARMANLPIPASGMGLNRHAIVAGDRPAAAYAQPRSTRQPAGNEPADGRLVGKTLAEVRNRLGRPQGIVRRGRSTTYFYGNTEIVSEDGHVVTAHR